MKITELVHSKNINSVLKSAGYTKLGSGVDASVWTKDGNSVIKLVMPVNHQESVDATSKMVIDFYEFAKKSNSPFFPKFVKFVNSEIEKFEEDGVHYILVGMEKLQKLNQRSDETAFYWLLTDLVTKLPHWEQVEQTLDSDKFWHDFLSTVHGNMAGGDNPEEQAYIYWQDMQDNYKVKSVMQAFYETMRACYEYGRSRGYGWDLHTENIMRRGRTPVIVDPWITI